VMLYGGLADIRRQFSGHAVTIRTGSSLPALKGVERIEPINGKTRLTLAPGTAPQDVLRALVTAGVNLEQFEISIPTLDEIFIRVVQGEGGVA
jgi:ABC-2 type transport system ATP-binding protein